METVIRPAALALLASYWTLNAQAQAPDDIAVRSLDQVLVQSALSAYQRHEPAVALPLLKRAVLSAPSLLVRLYLARSYAAVGKLVAAAVTYGDLVDLGETHGKNAAERATVESARDELAQLRPRIPSIEIALGDSEQRTRNLRLVLDGRLITYSAPVVVDPGHHEVVARDSDGEQDRIAFDVGEGETKTVGMNWRSTSRASKKTEQATVGGSSARRTWGVVALSVGATGLGVGTVTGIAALTRYSAAEAHCPANRCTEGAPYPEDGSAFRTLRTISVAGYVAGAGGIGTWLGLLLTTPAPKAEHPKVSPWTPVVGVGSAGARYIF
ncbi:MAG: hypothetical protein ABIQ16_16090 [Polyangiaceae bacterium]